MAKTSKKPKIKVGASSTVQAVNNHASVSTDCETDDEPPSKRVKWENSIADSTPEPVWEMIEKPLFHMEWTDIPDWSQREDCPLMDRLPVEVLDRIFCVRPELQLVDYLALAGSCRFFRDHMTDDFWEDLAFSECQKYSLSPNCFETTSNYTVPMPVPHPKAGLHPFSRSIADWKTTHPKTILDTSSYPVVKSLRTTSKWAEEVAQAQDRLVTHGPYTTGHYVPPGPRSKWSRAQYEIYKEEQACWRMDRSKRRLKGLQDLLAQKLATTRSNQDWSRPNLFLEGPLDRICIDGSEDGVDDIQEGNEQTSMASPISSATSTSISEMNSQIAQHEAILPDMSPVATAHMAQSPEDYESDSWQPPVSEPSEPDDEFEWLWDRGVKLVHDHWPSPWRSQISQRVNQSGIIESRAMRRYRLDRSELSNMKSTHGHYSSYGRTYWGPIYRKYAVESKAYKIRGGHEDHERYVDALFNQEVAQNQLKCDEIDRAIEAGEINHTWKPRPRRVAFECCDDDGSMCYCKRCWEGQCECGDYGKDLTRV